jgi:hypothetical protein
MSDTLAQARAALLAAGITGPHQSHSRANAISKIRDIIQGATADTFGLSGLNKYSAQEIHGFVSDVTGCSNDIDDLDGYDEMDADKTVSGILRGAKRLAESARRGDLLLAATGHPTGLLEHNMRVVDSYRRAGGKVLRLREDENLSPRKGRHIEVRYTGGVACLADWGQLRHTHSSATMELLLEAEPWPDIVLADHGFAGAAIEQGVSTVAVMDINDPALAVAWAEHKDVVIVPMDDNRLPRLYEPSWTLFEMVLEGREP